ncbi:trypsinogen-like protein 3 [Engraulis encrasicolus]|uniref:trypsinogen-like protein 3 n=1 Tax=Engraulis encrasicolus TaxID=184585 RepID=UPI002FD61595
MKRLLLLIILGYAGVSLGKDCGPFARPWMVIFNDRRSGALLNEYWVLTSFDHNADPSKMVARLGVDDLSETTDYEQRIPVERWINHDPYSLHSSPPRPPMRRKRSPMFDIALVRLAWSARFTTQVQPIPLPTGPARLGEHCVVSGWGSTIPYGCESNYKASNKQQCLQQPIVGGKYCHSGGGVNIFCAGYEDSAEGNCLSDSGSILSCGGVLHGVNAMGQDGCRGRPETYSSVYSYKYWINDIIHSYSYPTTLPPTTTTPTTVTCCYPTPTTTTTMNTLCESSTTTPTTTTPITTTSVTCCDTTTTPTTTPTTTTTIISCDTKTTPPTTTRPTTL